MCYDMCLGMCLDMCASMCVDVSLDALRCVFRRSVFDGPADVCLDNGRIDLLRTAHTRVATHLSAPARRTISKK